jgi:hypothetical protein
MNFSTKPQIALSFCVVKSPDADSNNAVMLSAASDKGEEPLES